MALPPRPVEIYRVVDHLHKWGEITEREASEIEVAKAWIAILEESGVLERLGSEDEIGVWKLTSKGEALLDFPIDGAIRYALFQVTSYRRYFLSILLHGLFTASRRRLYEEMDQWTSKDCSYILDEMNQIVDLVEARHGPIAHSSSESVLAQLRTFSDQANLDPWNELLLGRTGSLEHLFQFALRRVKEVKAHTSFSDGRPVALLQPLPVSGLNRVPSHPEPWCIRRKSVVSSLPIFEVSGNVVAQDQTDSCGCASRFFQAAVLAQPFYRAVVFLAISAWRSPVAALPEVALRTTSRLSEVLVAVGGREVGYLRHLLSGLVRVQGFRVCGLPNDALESNVMENLLENLIALRMLERKEGLIRLHPEYCSTLLSTHLRSVFRPAKETQSLLVEFLRSHDKG